ncbi:MAG TPA: LuxR C-terminal-related transcriptional regulator [Streptosporangiaceae bacterium]|nr:LuxR C-terminal-related transcriptional regulator [Streptosporangiaceae bacterium]
MCGGRARQKLSELEATILQSLATGVPSAHLAKELHLSRQGVDYHISHLLRRSRVPNRPALVARAYATGFFTMAAWPPQVTTDRVRRQPLGGSAATGS